MYAFDHSTPVTVSLRLQRGTADLVAENRPDIQVDLTAPDGAEVTDRFVVTLDADTLAVHAPESTWNWRRTPEVHVTIRVPLDSALAAKTAAADIRASGRWTTGRVDAASAGVHIEEVTGDALLKAASGDLTINRVGGSLRIGSSSGDLQIGDVTHDVKADTASGDITIGRVGGSLEADTASGDLKIGVVSQGRTKLRTASGDVSIGVAAGTGVWLDLNTASGSTTSDLTMGGSGAPGASGGELQQAALELRIRTASGDIDVHRAAAEHRAAA